MRYLHFETAREARDELMRIGVDPYGIDAMAPKVKCINVLLEGVECKIANILKQEMLSIGGDVAVSRGSVDCSVERTDALIIGTAKHIKALIARLTVQPFGLGQVASSLNALLNNIARDNFMLTTPQRTIEIGSRTLVMGILNVTPDSFSDGGMFTTAEDAVEYGLELADAGADMIDIGGESTRPGALSVDAEEEAARVIPVVESLSKRLSVPISIDTMKAEVAQRAIEAGAEIVNDVSALTHDTAMKEIAARYKVPVVLMHMRGMPETMQQGDLSYRSVIGDIVDVLAERIEDAVRSGIERENIIVDPGVGFGKSFTDNLKIIRRLSEFKILGRPILVGVSRKSFIGHITGGEPHDREEGTAAAVAVAITQGAHMVRVHDVRTMKRVSRMTDALIR